MSLNHSSSLVQRTIDLNYANKKRVKSFKWICLNATFLVIFVYDLSCKCPGYTSVLHYVELVCAGVLAANLVQHLLQLLPRRAPALPLSRAQQRLLGLTDTDLDSSFILSDDGPARTRRSASEDSAWSVSDAELSLSPRSWRSPSPASPSPPSPHTPPSPSLQVTPPRNSSFADGSQDHFIADRNSLTEYLKQYEERSAQQGGAAPAWAAPSPTPPHYQTASVDNVTSMKSEEGSPQGSPQVWWQLHLDPQRLTQFTLNLRLWIHVTILERLVRELNRLDAVLGDTGEGGGALDAGGAGGAGRVAPERLRALARDVPALAPLLPFLEPFPDRRYIVRRIRELSVGGCMSAYKWNGGGGEWDEGKPTDAELVLHLVATYLDIQTSGGMNGAVGGRSFSSEYLVTEGGGGGGGARRGAGALAIVRLGRAPPHYALDVGERRLQLPRGRSNLLLALLCLLAAAARRRPPALARTHLGPAGLNMLWIIGR